MAGFGLGLNFAEGNRKLEGSAYAADYSNYA
jgi:hypothetical protein